MPPICSVASDALADSGCPSKPASVSALTRSGLEDPALPAASKVMLASVWLPVKPDTEAPVIRSVPSAKSRLQTEPLVAVQLVTLTAEGS